MTDTTSRFPANDVFTFWHALELVKKCFLPILIVVVLAALPTAAATMIQWHGQAAASSNSASADGLARARALAAGESTDA